MIIWLASYPRSGNTFLRVLLNSCFGLRSYSQYNDIADIGGDARFSEIVGHETYQESWKQFYDRAANSNDQVIVKTHDAPLDSGKAIYLVRDPRSVAVSFHKYLQNFSTLKLEREHTIMGATAFGSWGEHIASWQPDKRENTIIIQFEELIKNPLSIAHKVGEFLNLEMINEKIPEFSDLKKINSKFFSSGSDKKNVSELSPEELNLLNFLFRTPMKTMGYEPDNRINRNIAMDSILRVSKDIWKLQYDVRTSIEKNATMMEAKEKKLAANHAAEIDRVRGEQKDFVDQLINSVQSSGVQAEALAKQSIALTEKFEKTNERLEDLWKQKSELTATIEILRSNRSELSAENDVLKAENRRLNDKDKQEITEALKKIVLLETKLEEQKSEKKSLESKIAYRERVMDRARIDLATTQALLEARTEETVNLRTQLSTERNRIDNLQNMMTEFSSQKIAREKDVRELEKNHELLQAKVADLSQRNQELSLKYSATKDQYLEINAAVAPRIKSILTLKPIRYVWNKRQLVKRGELKLDPLGLPITETLDKTLPANFEDIVSTNGGAGSIIKKRHVRPSVYSSYEIKKPLGIAVYTFDRAKSVENVLESLLLQDGLANTHVWIDGDQGNPKKRELLDKTEKLVGTFPVKQIHRNRGNYGFRKMMIVSMRKMFEMYERVLFLEDDCFPTRHALKGFSLELDQIEKDESIFSVYGHPFLTEQERLGPIGRFQGWGWASTRDKLMPIWPSLLDAYLMSEDEYKQFINAELSDELLKHVDATPGRQPSSTFKKFFAWDEALCFLAGKKGLTHKRTAERLIFNFGVGESSTHFGNIDYYRKPPFNMVSADEIWDHF